MVIMVAVGATNGMGGGAFNAAVDPGIAGNPTYNLLTIGGTNTITLGKTQIPSHTHIASSTASTPPHKHKFSDDVNNGGTLRADNDIIRVAGTGSAPISGDGTGNGYIYWTSSTSIDITVSTSLTDTGGGQSHNNIQPVLATYYIIYLP